MKPKQRTPPPAPKIGPGQILARAANAVPDFAMAGVYLLAWGAPHRLGVSHLTGLVLLMLLEFINIHSSAFMGDVLSRDKSRFRVPVALALPAKIGSVVALGVFYTLFVGGFSFIFKVWWPVGAFWLLTLNRLLVLLPARGSSKETQDAVQRGWGAAVGCYILALFAGMAAPAWGITAEVRQALDLPGGGLWVEHPQAALAAGFLYFGCMGLSDLFDHRWIMPGVGMGSGYRAAGRYGT